MTSAALALARCVLLPVPNVDRRAERSEARGSAEPVARWMPVGNASFVDWAMLTWEFGLMTSYLPFGWPSSSRARFAITSFVFMLIEVPAPP